MIVTDDAIRGKDYHYRLWDALGQPAQVDGIGVLLVILISDFSDAADGFANRWCWWRWLWYIGDWWWWIMTNGDCVAMWGCRACKVISAPSLKRLFAWANFAVGRIALQGNSYWRLNEIHQCRSMYIEVLYVYRHVYNCLCNAPVAMLKWIKKSVQ